MSLTVHLPPEKEAALQAKALAQGLSAEEYACQVLEQDLQTLERPTVRHTHIPHISEILAEIMADVPPDEGNR